MDCFLVKYIFTIGWNQHDDSHAAFFFQGSNGCRGLSDPLLEVSSYFSNIRQ